MATATQKRIKRRIKQDLRRAKTPMAAKEVLDELVEETEVKIEAEPEGRKPGLTRGSSKTTYTYPDLCDMFPTVSFTPEETIPLTFQGVKVQAYDGIEMHVPRCFKTIYDHHRKELKQMKETLLEAGLLDLGAGGLPPEVTA